MPTRYISSWSGAPGESTGAGMPIGRDEDNQVVKVRTKDGEAVSTLAFDGLQIITADDTAAGQDNGKFFVANSATSVKLNLPATATVEAGFKVGLIVGAVTAAGGHNVDPVAADAIVGEGLSISAGTALTCSAATDRLGDLIELTSNGAGTWYITRLVGTWA